MVTLPAAEFRIGILMACGCTAQGTLKMPGRPALVGCGLHNCVEVAESEPDLAGRMAECKYGGNLVPSSTRLAFFEHKPNAARDSYYCGCWGWD